MDPQRFDRLVRSIAGAAPSRRAVLRLVGGGIVAGVALREPAAVPASAKRKRKCKHGTERCKKHCVAPCPTGSERDPNTCRCCRSDFNTCTTGADCCSTICVQAIACGCVRPGQPCATSPQCCSRQCDANVCSCVPTGRTCFDSTDCCQGLDCIGQTCG